MENRSSISVNFGSLIWFLVGAFCSLLVNKSIFWAILHGLFGPFYVLYLCLGFGGGFDAVDSNFQELIAANPVVVVG